jgi:hypothetical protein
MLLARRSSRARSVERDRGNKAGTLIKRDRVRRQAIAVLRKRNVPIASLLTRAEISEGDIDDRQGGISALAQGKLLEYAAEALGDNEFGLHLAEWSALGLQAPTTYA